MATNLADDKFKCIFLNENYRIPIQIPLKFVHRSPPLPWASGLPVAIHAVAIQCAWNLDPSVHWNAIGERIVGSQCASSGVPVVFQWLSSGLPVCSNYAN